MGQRAVVASLEAALNGEAEFPTEPPQPAQPMSQRLLDMITFRDLEALLLRGCRNPANRAPVSHYVRWLSEVPSSWTEGETLLELLAVLAMAAEPPQPEAAMT